MSNFLSWLLVIAASIPIALLILSGVELGTLALWKLRRCPNCRVRHGFAGWDWSEWAMKYRFSARESGDGRFGDVVACPHCGYLRWVQDHKPFSAQ
jgi:hypothetical protein